MDDADKLFNNGANKIILNSALYETPELVNQIAEKYGSQSIVASIDYRYIEGNPRVLINDGVRLIDMHLDEYLIKVLATPVGEILLNSIDKDGTGFGFDLNIMNSAIHSIKIPLILMGGAGNELHLHMRE